MILLEERVGAAADGVEVDDGAELLRGLQDGKSVGSSQSRPLTLVPTMTPQKPRSRMHRSSSATDPAGSCKER